MVLPFWGLNAMLQNDGIVDSNASCVTVPVSDAIPVASLKMDVIYDYPVSTKVLYKDG